MITKEHILVLNGTVQVENVWRTGETFAGRVRFVWLFSGLKHFRIEFNCTVRRDSNRVSVADSIARLVSAAEKYCPHIRVRVWPLNIVRKHRDWCTMRYDRWRVYWLVIDRPNPSSWVHKQLYAFLLCNWICVGRGRCLRVGSNLHPITSVLRIKAEEKIIKQIN